jgi:UPF0755 protein
VKRLFLLFVAAVAAWVAYCLVSPVGPDRETFLEIQPGTPGMQIAAKLKANGLIRDQYVFEAMHLAKGGTIKAGEYRFDHPAKMDKVYDRLQRGDVYTLSVTIPEGANLFDIAQRLESAHLVPHDAFLSAARTDAALIADLDPSAISLEGYLFPDTYHFARRATPQQILAAMVRRFRQATEEMGLQGNYHHLVTMASLIERETPMDSERPLIASVFENRLTRGMPLETDPSVIYAALLEGRYRGTIYASDLSAESPYNTYKHTGLPPGPICNPGRASLRAAMRPAQTNYLYFVAASANPSGKSLFSETLEEHTRNVQQYRKSLHAAGSR